MSDQSFNMDMMTVLVKKIDHRAIMTLLVLFIIFGMMIMVFLMAVNILLEVVVTLADMHLMGDHRADLSDEDDLDFDNGPMYYDNRFVNFITKCTRTVLFVISCMVGEMLILTICALVFPSDNGKRHNLELPYLTAAADYFRSKIIVD